MYHVSERIIEEELKRHPRRDSVTVEWTNFQLDPEMATYPSKTLNQYLAEDKGICIEHAKTPNSHMTDQIPSCHRLLSPFQRKVQKSQPVDEVDDSDGSERRSA